MHKAFGAPQKLTTAALVPPTNKYQEEFYINQLIKVYTQITRPITLCELLLRKWTLKLEQYHGNNTKANVTYTE